MDLLEWLTGADTDIYASAKPPEFLGTDRPRPLSSPNSPTSVDSAGTSVETRPFPNPQYSLTPLESRIKNVILNVYSNKWIGDKESENSQSVNSQKLTLTAVDEQHKHLHSLPTKESQEDLKRKLDASRELDLSVELVSDTEESQTLGLGHLASLPSSVLRVGPVGGESLTSCAQLPPHIRRTDLPGKGSESKSTPKILGEFDFNVFEQELSVSRSTPEGISDSDTDLPQLLLLSTNSSSGLLTKQQLPVLQKGEETFKDRSVSSKMSDVHSLASVGSLTEEEMTSVPFFSADDRTLNPSHSEIPQVVPSMHKEDAPYANFYASSDSAIPNIPSALRPGGVALPYTTADDPDSNLSLLYSFSDSSYKSKMSKTPTKPRSQVIESFGVSMGAYQPSHSKPARSGIPSTVLTKKASSVGDESDKVLHFSKPRFVSESDQYPVEEKEGTIVTGSSGGSNDERQEEEEMKREEEEEEERNSLTPVFDTNGEDESKEATPVPEFPTGSNKEPAPLATATAKPVVGGQTQPQERHGVVDITASPLKPQLTGIDDVDSPGRLEDNGVSSPGHCGDAHPSAEEAMRGQPSIASQRQQEEKENLPPLSFDQDQPSYRVSRLDSDIETSSVVSVQELTETLLSEHGQSLQSRSEQPSTPLNPTGGKIPFSLPLIQPHTQDSVVSLTTPTHTSLPSLSTPPRGVGKLLTTPTKHTPPKPLLPLQPSYSKLPQHIQPSPKLPPKKSLPLSTAGQTRDSSPYSEVSESSSLAVQPVRSQPPWVQSETVRSVPVEEERSSLSVKGTSADEATQKEIESLENSLMKVLQEKANLEGQLESVTEECKVTMKDRADLQSQLARAETELAEMTEALEREKVKSSDSKTKLSLPVMSTQDDNSEIKEDLIKTKNELDKERELVATLKSELAKERQNARKLQNNLEWAKQSLEEQQCSMADLHEKVKDFQNTVDKKSSELEEAGAKLSSLEASYGALQGTKDWLHGQLENVLEEKKKLQDEWRESKTNAMAQNMRAEQLLKDNAALQQQVADLQQGILQDKAKLVNELEAIEADVLSREDSYSHLVTDKARLEDVVKRKEDTLQKINSELARAQVEKEELETKMEDSEMQNDVLNHKVEDLEHQREALAKKLKLASQELDAKTSDVKEIEKVKASLQERLKQLDTALVSKDGTCQGLRDANEILKHELEAVKQDRDQLEEELDKTKKEMTALQANLKLATDSNRGRDTAVKSLEQLREASSAESQALREKLTEKERELEEKTNEMESLEVQSGELLEQFKALQNRFHSIAADTGSVQESVAEKDRVIAHLASEKDRAEQELSSLKEECEQFSNKLIQVEHDNARLQGEVEASSSGGLEEFQKAIQDKAQLQAELNSLKLGQQHESIRAQAKASRLEADLKVLKNESEKAKEELKTALKQKEEEVGGLEEEKLKVESALRDLKNRFEHAQREKERLQSSVETQKPASSTLEALTARCEQLAQQNQVLVKKLQQEASQRAEVERASGMVAAKLKQNAQQEEKKLQQQNRDLSLELERLRGRLSGMSTTQSALREHAASLEAALAKRDSSLVKLSAQTQKVLEDKELEDQAFAAQIASLEKKNEDAAREKDAWKAKAQTEKKKTEELGQQLSRKDIELVDVKAQLDQALLSRCNVPHLEEKIAQLAVEKDDFHSQINDLKMQLTVARTAVDMTKKDLSDRSSQVDILKKELDMARSQRALAESDTKQLQDQLRGAEERHQVEVGRLREVLQKERESSVVEEGNFDARPGLLEMSVSTIGTEDVDRAQSGWHEYLYFICTHICLYMCVCLCVRGIHVHV